MKEKIYKLMYPLIAVCVGLLFIILMKAPYIAKVDGYQVLSAYTTGFLGFVLAFFGFLHLVSLLVLLNLGILGLLEKMGVVEFKKQIFGLSYNKFVKIMISVVAGLALLTLLFIIIWCAVNSVSIGFGSILNAVLEIMCAVLVWLFAAKGILDGTYVSPKKEKKEDEEPENLEEVVAAHKNEEEVEVQEEPADKIEE